MTTFYTLAHNSSLLEQIGGNSGTGKVNGEGTGSGTGRGRGYRLEV
jgi:hypothetical protein